MQISVTAMRLFTLVSFCALASPAGADVPAPDFAAPLVSVKISEFDIPIKGAGPIYIIPDPHGTQALWFTEYYENTIGQISTKGEFAEHKLTESPAFDGTPGAAPQIIVPDKGSYPYALAKGPDGNVWFTDDTSGTNIVGALKDGKVAAYAASSSCCLQNLTTGSDGAIWYLVSNYNGNLGYNQVGRITAAGKVTFLGNLAYGSVPSIIVAGPDGALWFTEEFTNKIARLTTSGNLHEYTIPSKSSYPYGIVVGPDKALWFTESGTNKIGRITTGGSFKEYTVPTKNSGLAGIAAGPDGALWFAEKSAGKIGRITTSGVFEEFKIPTADSQPYWLTTGPDKAIWFTEFNGDKIGRLAIL